MRSIVRALACTVLGLSFGSLSFSPVTDERTTRLAQLAEAAARQAQEAQRRREARLRWAYEYRRSAAHARMPSTPYRSTPRHKAQGDLSGPALVDEDTRRIHRRLLDGRGDAPSDRSAFGLVRPPASRASGVNVFPAVQRSTAAASGPSGTTRKDEAGDHLIQASG